MKEFMNKYNEQIKKLFTFFIIYMIGFMALENRVSYRMVYTDSVIDTYIPFNEYFVIPYLLWFLFIGLGFCYFVFIDHQGFQRTCFYLFSGMLIALLVYVIFPNGQSLRVNLNNDNIFQCLVSFIYSVDPAVNVCPSIHVYNSVMMMITLYKSDGFREKKWLVVSCFVLTILICMSTLLIKQHAFIDVICAVILCIVIYNVGKKKFGY